MENINTNWEKDRKQLMAALEQLLKVKGIISVVIDSAVERKIMLPIREKSCSP